MARVATVQTLVLDYDGSEFKNVQFFQQLGLIEVKL